MDFVSAKMKFGEKQTYLNFRASTLSWVAESAVNVASPVGYYSHHFLT